MYGAWSQFGYGDLETIFAVTNIVPNLQRYPRWLIESHTPFLLLSVIAPIVSFEAGTGVGRRIARGLRWLCLVFALGVLASYLPYMVFEAWWYTRFLLPALPLAIVLSTSVAMAGARRLPRSLRSPVVVLGCGALVLCYVDTANRRGAFAVQASEQEYVATGLYVASALPKRAVVLTMQHSGSVRHYSGRPTVRWDGLDPAALDTVLLRSATGGTRRTSS